MSLEELRSVGVTYRAPPRFYGFIDIVSGRLLSVQKVESRLRRQQARFLRTLIEQGVIKPQRVPEKVEIARDFWRYSYGVSFPQHSRPGDPRYFGGIIEAWSFDRNLLARNEKGLQDILMREVEKMVDSLMISSDGEGYQIVMIVRRLEDTYEWRTEDENGDAIKSGEGEL